MSASVKVPSPKYLSGKSQRLKHWITSMLAPGSTTPIPPVLATASLRIALTAFCLGTLAGLVLPRAVLLLSSSSWYHLQGSTAGWTWIVPMVLKKDVVEHIWQYPQLNFYLLAWSLFHLLEFVITARYNATRLYSDSFLIQNGITYHLAHIFGIAEFLLEAYCLPEYKRLTVWTGVGIGMLLSGQVVRSLGMIHAAGNFSHEVAATKRSDHELVTKGVYAFTRHPAYFGFFYWALGTQILLGNPVSTFVFAIILWRFFEHRIKGEEVYLVSFFGEQYVEYRRRTRTFIPFIR
ncbi:hypothetical protein CBS101457_001717 [Exobasidium rhododendri]|nr:hypothetical protein CBS101457_001717 [Exobasidium rhododendri]